MFSYILVGGFFSDEGGRPSGYVRKLFEAMQPFCTGKLINGGSFRELVALAESLEAFEVIFWMPDVPNEKEKFVKKIKVSYPKSILVTSKNNLDGMHPFYELVARALSIKSNLFVEFTDPDHNSRELMASIYDPLGNCFCQSKNIDNIAASLISRVFALRGFTRVSSVRNDDIKLPLPPIPEQFLTYVREYAEKFHGLMFPWHSHPADRLLGNVSFRCEKGFPSFRTEDTIYVSKRNVDKRLMINMDFFVQVKLISYNDLIVEYVGENKPSVDTPIQLLLYRYYPRVNFMLHSHTYISGAPFTHSIVPCGAVEEFFEIIKIAPWQFVDNIAINLKGHGSLVMVKDIKNFRDTRGLPIEYKARPMPEIVN
jgi:hypothetical protein